MEMSELFTSSNLVFKKKDTFACVYNNRTGWYFPGSEGLLRFLESFQYGREIDAQERESDPKLDKLLTELTRHRYLLSERGRELSEYLNFYPMRTNYTVYYHGEGGTDVAIQRKGISREVDFEVITIKGFGEALWNLCDGSRTVSDIIGILAKETRENYGTVKRRALDQMREWTSIDVQILRLLPSSISSYSGIPSQLNTPPPFQPTIKTSTSKFAGDVKEYHITGIHEGYDQFERVESTLSHIYRKPHSILGGKSYGEALLSRLVERISLESNCRILEVGGGHGDISKDILLTLKNEKPGMYPNIAYIIYDLAPRLIESQRRLHREHGTSVKHIHGDGEQLALADASIDIVISNEVIADFQTPEMTIQEVKELPKRYGIPINKQILDSLKNAPVSFRLNLGALRLLKEVERVLKPGGLGIITEYGFEDRLPFLAKHLDHAEYSINFSHMLDVANALGLDVELTDAFRFLNFRADVELITHPSFQAAFRILEKNDVHLPNLVYTSELFQYQLGDKADSFENVEFVECRREPIEIVKVLLFTKPLKDLNNKSSGSI